MEVTDKLGYDYVIVKTETINACHIVFFQPAAKNDAFQFRERTYCQDAFRFWQEHTVKVPK